MTAVPAPPAAPLFHRGIPASPGGSGGRGSTLPLDGRGHDRVRFCFGSGKRPWEWGAGRAQALHRLPFSQPDLSGLPGRSPRLWTSGSPSLPPLSLLTLLFLETSLLPFSQSLHLSFFSFSPFGLSLQSPCPSPSVSLVLSVSLPTSLISVWSLLGSASPSLSFQVLFFSSFLYTFTVTMSLAVCLPD